jgi:hypothetical protein
MAEQIVQVVNNEMKFNGNVARVSSTVVAANPEAGVRADTLTRVTPLAKGKTLTERINEAYGDELEPEERELLDHAAEQFGRRLSSEE